MNYHYFIVIYSKVIITFNVLSNMDIHYSGKKSGGGGRREGTQAPDAESERKDSLSVNVEFVKFNLSRSRKVNFDVDSPKAVVRFSTLIDIGSASFKYDMRRLPEILAFPKAWYRRTIVRHLFLGDLSKNDPSDASVPPASRDLWAELQPDQSGLSKISSWETLVVFAVNFTKLNVHMNMGNVMGNVSWLTKVILFLQSFNSLIYYIITLLHY